jgi:hypothetical protein
MLTTDFASLFKQIASSIPEYLMFLLLLIILYVFVGALVKLITESIIKVILAIRAPITFKVKGDEE